MLGYVGGHAEVFGFAQRYQRATLPALLRGMEIHQQMEMQYRHWI
jgi:hypothetical protein